MSLFRTETPSYRGQRQVARPSPGYWDRIVALFRVATPAYKTAPASPPSYEPSQPEPSPDESCQTDGPVLSQSPPRD